MQASLLLLASLAASVYAVFTPPIVSWDTATVEPSINIKGMPIIGGGMPVGNGETACLVFPLKNAPFHYSKDTDFSLPSGVSFFVSMATAMASDTSLFQLGEQPSNQQLFTPITTTHPHQTLQAWSRFKPPLTYSPAVPEVSGKRSTRRMHQ